jgi:hypothetical protein
LNKYRYAIGYILCVAFISVIRAKLLLSLSPIIVLLISSTLASIYFHLINYKNSFTLYKKFFNRKLSFIALNFIVALMWFATYYSIYFSSAAIFVFEFFMVGGFLSMVSHQRLIISQKIMILFFSGLIFAPLFIYKTQYVGVCLGIIAGGCGFLYNIWSDRIASFLNINASQILASRFWLLILVSTALLPNNFSTQLSFYTLSTTIFITVVSFILQIWLNQKSVLTIGGKESSYIASFAPALTFLVQGTVLGNWVFPILLLSVFGSICIMYDSYVRDNNIQGERLFSCQLITQK